MTKSPIFQKIFILYLPSGRISGEGDSTVSATGGGDGDGVSVSGINVSFICFEWEKIFFSSTANKHKKPIRANTEQNYLI